MFRLKILVCFVIIILFGSCSKDPIKKSILTVGSYDGIHRGHQKLLSHLVEKSKVYGIPSVLVTFDPHPRHILNKKTNSLPLLMSLDQKLNIVESIGIDIVYVIDFTFHFSLT